MKSFIEVKRPYSIVFVSLVFVFGLQVLRAFFPSVIWYLSASMNEMALAGYALVTFALVFLAPILSRRTGFKAAFGIATGGLLLARLVLQFADNALFTLILSTSGVVFFILFLTLWMQSELNRDKTGSLPISAIAFPLAFLVDTVSRSLLWSYDLTWRTSFWAVALAVILVALAAVWLVGILRQQLAREVKEPAFGSILPLAGLGAWLFLSQSVWLNPQAVMGKTGWSDGPAHLLASGMAALGFLMAVWLPGQKGGSRLAGTLLAVLGTLVGAFGLYLKAGPVVIWLVLFGLSAWPALGLILYPAAAAPARKRGLWGSAAAVFLACLTLIVFVFMNEFFMAIVLPLAGVALALLAGLAALMALPPMKAAWAKAYRAPAVTAVAAFALVAVWARLNLPHQVQNPMLNDQARVMTYNIHQGLDAGLNMDLEDIIATIEAQHPDILSLNEVNRARANNGYNDTLGLISKRLGYQYVVFGANFEDGQYGNAILSRYPIVSWENTHYATNTTEVRGLLHAQVLVGSRRPLDVYSTHFDHIGTPDNARAAQAAEALQRIGSAQTAIFVGDLNATPDAEELQGLYQSQLVDVLDAMGNRYAPTFWSPANERIDYVFVTPDIQILDAAPVESKASDHRPIVVDVKLP